MKRTSLAATALLSLSLALSSARAQDPAALELPDDLILAKNVEEIPCVIPVPAADSSAYFRASCEITTRQEPNLYYISAVPDKAMRFVWLDFKVSFFINGKWRDSGTGIFQPGKVTRLDLVSLNLPKAATFKVTVYLAGRTTVEVPVAVLILPPAPIE